MGIPGKPRSGGRAATLLLVLAGSACAILGFPTLPEGWTREELRLDLETRSPSSQRLRYATPDGSVELEGTIRRHSPQDVPGWDRPRSERAGSAIGGLLQRQVGFTTANVVIGHGDLSVSGPGTGEWELRCTVLWIVDEDIEHDRARGEDRVFTSRARTEGMDCRAARTTQPDVTVWRFGYGIAPPLDSLAATYDSLAAEGSPLLSAEPRLELLRLEPGGEVGDRYRVQAEFNTQFGRNWLRVRTPDDQPLAHIHLGIDFAPASSSEEKTILRMIALTFAEAQRR